MQIQPFSFNGAKVRVVIDENGEPLFIAADVCRVLDISNSRDAVSRLDDDERVSVVVDTLGGKQAVTAVNESGLYELVLSSRKSEAKAFKRWIKREVLPSIRKTGSYSIAPKIPTLEESLEAQRQLADTALKLLKDNQQLKLQNEEMKPKAAYYDTVAESGTLIPMSTAAKTLKLEFGRNNLYERMRKDGIMMKKGTEPYQRYVDAGYFVVRQGTRLGSGGKVTSRTPRW